MNAVLSPSRDCRTAYHESIQLGNELTKKVHEDIGAASGGEGGDAGEGESDGDEEAFTATAGLRSLQSVLHMPE